MSFVTIIFRALCKIWSFKILNLEQNNQHNAQEGQACKRKTALPAQVGPKRHGTEQAMWVSLVWLFLKKFFISFDLNFHLDYLFFWVHFLRKCWVFFLSPRQIIKCLRESFFPFVAPATTLGKENLSDSLKFFKIYSFYLFLYLYVCIYMLKHVSGLCDMKVNASLK